MTNKKGQGSTEYLVILAVVLIVALVAIALLGFFPGLATDAQKTQSDSYWTGTAYPFKIVEHKAVAGTLTLIVQNSDSKKLVLTGLNAESKSANFTDGVFLGGEKKKTAFTITNLTTVCPTGATRYAISGSTISFAYDSDLVKNQTQGGDAAVKDLVGSCGS